MSQYEWATARVYPWVSEQTPVPVPAVGTHPWEQVQVWGTGLPAGAALDTTTTTKTMTKRQPHYCGNCIIVIVIHDEGTGRG